jgi:hypothetical protein
MRNQELGEAFVTMRRMAGTLGVDRDISILDGVSVFTAERFCHGA